jgi:tetratricopeptide (TPR) repeat protein
MATATDRLQELGLEFGIAAMDAFKADCELALGNVDEAERLFRGAHELLGKIGDESGAAAVASALGRACLLQGDIEEAERLTSEGERGLPENTLHFRSRWRGPRSLLLARAGRIEEAQEVALAWQRHIDSTDALMHRADARMDMAEILRSAGDPKGARDLAEDALGLYRQKEDRADEARAERFLAELT